MWPIDGIKRLAIILVLMSGAVRAEPITGNEMLEICEGFSQSVETINNGVCLAYAVGAWHGMMQGAIHATTLLTGVLDDEVRVYEIASGLLQVCMPKGIPNGQTVAIIIKYIDDNPAQRHFPVTWIIPDALGDAFPCD